MNSDENSEVWGDRGDTECGHRESPLSDAQTIKEESIRAVGFRHPSWLITLVCAWRAGGYAEEWGGAPQPAGEVQGAVRDGAAGQERSVMPLGTEAMRWRLD
jgi:hypothetical protein